MDKKIVMLSGQTQSTIYMYNGLAVDYKILWVIQEEPIDMKRIMKKRAKRLGYFNALGQILFGICLLPFLRRFSTNISKKNIQKLKLNESPIPLNKIKKVKSVNAKETIELLKKIDPDIVVVNGCRIISEKVLNSIHAIFINTHEGITPRYRGIHGAYWALVNKDEEHCGVTVHLVDKGVDTGGIIYQGIIKPNPKDNFTTYPAYQTAKGIELMKNAIDDFYSGGVKTHQSNLESNIWFHPTIWQYLYNRFFRGVK